MKAKQFDEKFELGEDLTDDLDLSKARKLTKSSKRTEQSNRGDRE